MPETREPRVMLKHFDKNGTHDPTNGNRFHPQIHRSYKAMCVICGSAYSAPSAAFGTPFENVDAKLYVITAMEETHADSNPGHALRRTDASQA